MRANSFFPTEIEFNITGNYGSPVHVNHNANYSSTPSPDMDPADRRQPEQARRPLSVATDNMMLEFYKKDGYAVVSLLQCWDREGCRAVVRLTRRLPSPSPGSVTWWLSCDLILMILMCPVWDEGLWLTYFEPEINIAFLVTWLWSEMIRSHPKK